MSQHVAMTTAFVKIYGDKLINSTLWCECWQARLVFVGMLAMADINGRVPTPSVRALAMRLNLPVEDVQAGVDVLEAEDADSRTKDEQGKRIVFEGDHWRIVNYTKYREMRTEKQEYDRLRQMQLRRATHCDTSDESHRSQSSEFRVQSSDSEPESGRISTPTNPRSRSARTEKHSEAARRVFAEHDRLRRDVNPRLRGLKATAKILSSIAARIEEHGEEACYAVLRQYHAEAVRSCTAKWLNGVTPFRPDNFTRALAQDEPESTESGSEGQPTTRVRFSDFA